MLLLRPRGARLRRLILADAPPRGWVAREQSFPDTASMKIKRGLLAD